MEGLGLRGLQLVVGTTLRRCTGVHKQFLSIVQPAASLAPRRRARVFLSSWWTFSFFSSSTPARSSLRQFVIRVVRVYPVVVWCGSRAACVHFNSGKRFAPSNALTSSPRAYGASAAAAAREGERRERWRAGCHAGHRPATRRSPPPAAPPPRLPSPAWTGSPSWS